MTVSDGKWRECSEKKKKKKVIFFNILREPYHEGLDGGSSKSVVNKILDN